MRKTKIEYGIDLGTTNSSISTIKNGKIEIIKNPMNQKEVTPSCVYFYSKKTIVGDKAKNKLEQENLDAFRLRTKKSEKNGFSDFKRTMGYDTEYYSQNRQKSFSSEELSAEVIKTLKSYVVDEEITTSVITVPMRFSAKQIEATQRAAELAGLEYCELLPEPIAAAMAFGLHSNNINGYFLVFDFGGGTFDVALMHIEDKIMKVIDTSGDSKLGGKDIDQAIVNDVLISYLKGEYKIDEIVNSADHLTLLKEAIKNLAEEGKIALSTKEIYTLETGEPIEYDEIGYIGEIELSIERKDIERVVNHLLQRSIDITIKLLVENDLSGSDLQTILLVGGTTYIPILRKMIQDQISNKINTSINPMTAVSLGAALYAFTKDIPEYIQDKNRDKTKIQLQLEYPETTVEKEVKLGVKIQKNKMECNIPELFQIEIVRSDKGWSSGLIKIADSAIIDIHLNENETNNFIISLFDNVNAPYPCEPNNFNILQGFLPPKTILPFDLCIGIHDEENNYEKLELIKGLEKNNPIKDYIKGKTKILHTNQDIRPGKEEDKIRIPIYQGTPLSRTIYNEMMAEVIITGKNINEFLPKDSEVQVTLKIDSSRRNAELTAFFPYIDETVKIEKVILTNASPKKEDLEKDIIRAKAELSYFQNESISFDKSLEGNINQINKDLENDTDDDTKNKVLNRMREIFIEIDKINNEHQFPKMKKEMNDLLNDIKLINERYGNNNTSRIIIKLEEQSNEVSDSGELPLIQDFIKELRSFRFSLLRTRIEYWLSIIKHYDNNFESCIWKNKKAAQNLISQAKEVMLSSEPTAEKMENITFQIWDLIIDNDITSKSDEFIKEFLKE